MIQDLRVENPVLDIAVSVVGLSLGLVPAGLDLLDQAVLVLLAALLDLLALASEVVLELVGVPGVVGLDGVVIPILLNEVLEIFAVGSSWKWDVVIGQPALELSLVPLVVRCAASR